MARKTVLVCDNCGKEVDEGKVPRCASRTRTRGEEPRPPISATTARARCRAARRRAEAAGRRRLRSGCTEHHGAVLGGLEAASEAAGRRTKLGWMPLALLVGPANAGKVARLLDRYLETIDRDPVLVVPNRFDRDRVERDLLGAPPPSFGGTIGTFDDLFEGSRGETEPIGAWPRRPSGLSYSSALSGRPPERLSASARYGGFTGGLFATISELEGGLLGPEDLDGDLAPLYTAYHRRARPLRPLGPRSRAAPLPSSASKTSSAWDGGRSSPMDSRTSPVRSGRLLRALAGRADVTVSLPYEPGRPFSPPSRPRRRTFPDLRDGAIESCRLREEGHTPALVHCERQLFGTCGAASPPLEGAIRFLEGAGARGSLELVGEEILALLRSGTAPEEIAVVVPSLDQWRAPLETAFGTLGVPFSFEAQPPPRADGFRPRSPLSPRDSSGVTRSGVTSSPFSAPLSPGSRAPTLTTSRAPARSRRSHEDGGAHGRAAR